MEILISQRIRELRIEKKISQKEFADACGVMQSCVSKWERGATYPPLESVADMCKIFDVSSDYLLGLTEY